jgi:hypothetical protein
MIDSLNGKGTMSRQKQLRRVPILTLKVGSCVSFANYQTI